MMHSHEITIQNIKYHYSTDFGDPKVRPDDPKLGHEQPVEKH